MKVRVFTNNQLPRSTHAGGGHHWVEEMTMERLLKLASLEGCILEVQSLPGADQDPEVKLWVTLYGIDSRVTAEIENGGDPGWGT